MKCPLRLCTSGNFGYCYEDECSWWKCVCIVLGFANKQTPERPPLRLKSNKLYTASELAGILRFKE